jgi:hypothetical protein
MPLSLAGMRIPDRSLVASFLVVTGVLYRVRSGRRGHLVAMLRMGGAIPLLRLFTSWRGQGQFSPLRLFAKAMRISVISLFVYLKYRFVGLRGA